MPKAPDWSLDTIIPWRKGRDRCIAGGADLYRKWFQIMKNVLKRRAPRRNVLFRLPPRRLMNFDKRGRSRLVFEITALHQVVAKLREELKAANEREASALYLAFHDDLTALPNRRFFRQRLEVALTDDRKGVPVLAVIYLDLDGFKALNDAHGHDTGDKLLNLVAARLNHGLRINDLVSRLGGDEYACLVMGVSSRDRLKQIAVTLFEAVSQPFTIGALVLNVRPSIGIAVYPSDGITADTLLQAADGAMYGAKRSKSNWSFSEGPLALASPASNAVI